MRFLSLTFCAFGAVCILGGCTERRTASDPVADGDTIEVIINEEDSSPVDSTDLYIDSVGVI